MAIQTGLLRCARNDGDVNPTPASKPSLLYDRFTHEGMERRAFMAEMAKLAGSLAAAELLVAGIAASPAAAAIVPENDPHIFTRTQTLTGGYKAYVAEPRTRSLKATVLVIHENRGLNDHIRDVARRVAVAGFRAVAPDMLSPTAGLRRTKTPRATRSASSISPSPCRTPSPWSTSSRNRAVAARSARSASAGAADSSNRLAVAAGDDLAAAVPITDRRRTRPKPRRSRRRC